MVGDWLNFSRRIQPSTAHTAGETGCGVLGAGAMNGLRMFVATALRNLITPTAGAATCAVGATGATTSLVDALLAVVAPKAFTALDVVAVADDSTAASTALTEATGVDAAVVLDDGVFAASAVTESAEPESVLAEVDVDCTVSGAGVGAGVVACAGSDVSLEAAGVLEFGCASTLLVSIGDSVPAEF